MTKSITRVALMAATAAIAAAGLSGCGKIGIMEQPAPLFGERARADYEAQRRAREAQNPNAPAGTPAADQADPNADNAPRTSRDVKDPGQNNVPASQQPIEGVPDLMGPPPSMSPPGA